MSEAMNNGTRKSFSFFLLSLHDIIDERCSPGKILLKEQTPKLQPLEVMKKAFV